MQTMEKYPTAFSSKLKHSLHCCAFFSVFITIELLVGGIRLRKYDSVNVDPIQAYGVLGTIILYILRFIPILILPASIFNCLGLTLYNAFPGKIELKNSPALAPFICVRTVTRGDYPQLVANNVIRNINTCLKCGLKNFIVEVVTDKALDLPKHRRIRETVVPTAYKTKNGSLFKARALQYCLEDDVNTLSDNDWIVHLDEETLLTDDSVKGILNFVAEGKCQIGQGAITYANETVINWITTIADSYRVGNDMGYLRFQLKMLHKPLLPLKGSFLVAEVSAERKVSFDFGPEGSVLEDNFFCMTAYRDGYKFDFIEGEMWEKSAFTVWDQIRQNKRWTQGTFLLVFHSKTIPFRFKSFMSISFYAVMLTPLTALNIILSIYFPLSSSQFVDFVLGFLFAMTVYVYLFGAIKSFDSKRLGYTKFTICVISAMCIPFYLFFIGNIAVVWAIFSSKIQFYILDKKISATFDSAADRRKLK